MRAAYAALVLGLAGGLWLATTVMSTAWERPVTVVDALGLGPAGATLDERRAAAVAVLTAECMRKLGLTWRLAPEPVPRPPDPDLGPVAWADRWGFGVSTRAADQAAPAGDPNLAVLAALPEAVRDRYRDALQGTGGRPGCRATANEAVYGVRDRLLHPLRRDLDALDASIAADPAIARALSVWRGCVADVSDGLTIDRRGLPAALMERFAARAAMSTPGWAEWRRLQDDERRIAGVLARCEEAYMASRTRAAARREAAFVASHLTQLREIGAAIRAAEAALPTLPP